MLWIVCELYQGLILRLTRMFVSSEEIGPSYKSIILIKPKKVVYYIFVLMKVAKLLFLVKIQFSNFPQCSDLQIKL